MSFDRRAFLAISTRAGLASTLFPGALYTLAAQAQSASSTTSKDLPKITPEMIDAAAALAGITIAPDQKAMMLDGLNEQRAGYSAIRKLQLAEQRASGVHLRSSAAGRQSQHRQAGACLH